MATVTGLTAERMQEIIDQQIVAGAVDLSGHLKMTRADGTFFDAGLVKGDKGDDAVYPFPNYVSGTDIRFVRIGVMDGIHASQGAAMQFIISGLGGFGTARRGTVLVHAAQRGVGGVNLTAWSWGLDATAAGAITLYTRQTGDFLFEIWAKLGTYIPKATLLLLSAFGSTVTLDSQSTVDPGSLVAGTITRSDSPMATQTLAGISELATNAETLTGTDTTRVVTPAGLKSVLDPIRDQGPRHAEFKGTFALQNAGSGPSDIPSIPRDTVTTTDNSVATPTSGGFNLPAGLFLVSISVGVQVSPVSALTRSFIDMSDSVTGRAFRVNGVQGGEDKYSATTSIYFPSAGKLTIGMYQVSGTSRNIDIQIRITQLR